MTVSSRMPIASDLIHITYSGAGRSRSFSSSEPVFIGRDRGCDLRIDDPRVHPLHVEIYRVFDVWWVRDLESDTGTFLDEECIDVAPVIDAAVLQFGSDGPAVWLQPRAARRDRREDGRISSAAKATRAA